MSVVFCHRCGASLARDARFCGECGAPSRLHARRKYAELQRERQRDARHGWAVAILFVGVLGGMIVLVPLGERLGLGDEGAVLSAFVAQVAVGLSACAVVGKGALRESFAGPVQLADMVLGVAAGICGFAVAWGYVGLLSEGAGPGEEFGWLATLSIVVGAPLIEEWTDRGVLWRALRPLTSAGGTIVASATLFALLHGLNGGFVLELPHRFVAGLLFGWLRARSGSLLPGIVAHATLNGLAVAIA